MRVSRRRFLAATGAATGWAVLGRPGSHALAVPAKPRLLFVGDSLTGGSVQRRTLRGMLERSDLWSSVTVNGRNGRKIADAVPIVDRHQQNALADGVTSICVIALGTNDLSHTWLNTARARALLVARVESVVAAADGALVLWVNTSFSRRRPGYPGRARRFNALLDEVAERTHNLEVIDWYSTHGPRSPHFAADGIHLTSRGFLRRARLTARVANETARTFAPEPV